MFSQPSSASNRVNSAGYLAHDTIAAVSTAAGGPVAMIRISGPEAFSSVLCLLDSRKKASFPSWAPGSLHRIKLYDSEGIAFDSAMIVKFAAPASFTGEDIVELHLHGSPIVISRALECLRSVGVRSALPGEFSFRGVRNGKFTLPQAQAIADLIGSTNESAARLALEKLEGSQNRLITELAQNLRNVAMLSEAGIDFSDQEIDALALSKLKDGLHPLLENLRKLSCSFERGHRIQAGVKIAFLGLPNAGKSSFFNSLLGEDRSIVSEIPGTTRDVVREHLVLASPYGSITLRLEDTAGLRTSSDVIENLGIERSQKSAQEADLILFLIDAGRNDLIDAARMQWESLGSPAKKTIGILTKADILKNVTQDRAILLEQLRSVNISKWIFTSSRTSAGIPETVQEITSFCRHWFERAQGEVVLTHIEHKNATDAALSHLERALGAPEYDLFASDIRQALKSLSPLIGETQPDDILGAIFSTFCIGK